MSLKEQLAARIREARTRLGIGQQQLAEATGFQHPQTISDIERGVRDVRASELVRLAKALHFSVADLLSDRIPEPAPVLWRNAPAQSEVIEAKFLERCRQYRFLEELTGQVRETLLPSEAISPDWLTHAQAEAMATRVGQQLALGAKPAAALIQVLEDDFGVKVWHEDLAERGSASCTIGDFGPAILVNSSEPRWRRNFSVAHDLFHLVTWKCLPPELLQTQPALAPKVERLANAFAAALLLPSDTVRAEAERRARQGKISIHELIDVARQFHVSTDALFWRLVNVGWLREDEAQKILDGPEFQLLDSAARRADWDRPPAPPLRFARLAHLAYTRGDLSRGRLAALLTSELADLEEKLESYGLTNASGFDAELTAPV